MLKTMTFYWLSFPFFPEVFCIKNLHILNAALLNQSNNFFGSPNDMVYQKNCQIENINLNFGCVSFSDNFILFHKIEWPCIKNLQIFKNTHFYRTNSIFVSLNHMVFLKNCQVKNMMLNLACVIFLWRCFLKIYIKGPLQFPIKTSQKSIFIN